MGALTELRAPPGQKVSCGVCCEPFMADKAVSTFVPVYHSGEEDLCLSLPKTVA